MQERKVTFWFTHYGSIWSYFFSKDTYVVYLSENAAQEFCLYIKVELNSKQLNYYIISLLLIYSEVAKNREISLLSALHYIL